MEDSHIYFPQQTPDKTNTKENTRSFSNSSPAQTKSPRAPKIPNILSRTSLPPSEPIPIHITSERYSIPGDQGAPQSLLTLISLNSPTKGLFTSVINAAASAASALNFTKLNQLGNPEIKPLCSSYSSVNSEERQTNLIPYLSRIKQPAMATSATDLSIASAVTAGSPTSTIEHLEQISNHSNSIQTNHSDFEDSSSDFDVSLSRSKSAPNRGNLGRSSSLLRRARPRSNTFTHKDDAHDSEGSNMTTATKKKNTDFHQLFKEIPASAVLIEDYSCAIQKDILVHGRMYITEDFICFYANIFGFVTNIIIKFKEVVSIERRNMAFFVPNAVLISTLQNKYLFGSFLAREAAFNCLVYLWRKNHPALVENLAYCDSETNFESPYNVGPQTGSESDYEGVNSDELSEEGSFDAKEVNEKVGSGDGATNQQGYTSSRPGAASHLKTSMREKRTASIALRNNEPTKTTVCDCYDKNHFRDLLIDTVIPAPLNKVYNVLYGDGGQGMKEFLIENRNKEVEVTPWSGNKRTLNYIMPINVPFGPKHTKCKVIEEIDHKAFDKYTSVVATISTPDVPNGSYFNPQTRTCFMHAGNGNTRMIVTGAITWHKSSWFKSQIERSTYDGSVIVAKDTENFIVRHIADNSSDAITPAVAEPKKAKKHVRINNKRSMEPPSEKTLPIPNESQASSRSPFSIKDLTSSNMLLLFVLVTLAIANIIGWYQIYRLSQQIQHTETRLTRLVTGNAKPEQQSSPTPVPSYSEEFGEQLRHVQQLLRNIDQKMIPAPSN